MAWRIQYQGELKVFSPESRAIHFPTRKAAALVALLALEEGRRATYAQIASWLWPSFEASKGYANARQAVAMARRALGSAHLVSISQGVALALDFSTDLDSATGELLVEFEGQPFDGIRERHSKPLSAGLQDNFVNVLYWYSQYDMDGMFEMMRADLGLSLNLGPKILLPLISSFRPLRKMKGWSAFWKGYCSLNTDPSGAALLLRSAAQAGLDAKDWTLGVQAYVWASCAHILAGEMPSASQTIALGRNLAIRTRDPNLVLATEELQATLLLHTDQYPKAVKILREAADSDIIGKIQWASNMSSVAFYEACAGEEKLASRHLEAVRAVSAETKLLRIDLISDLAEGYLRLNGGDLPGAESAFRRLEDVTRRQGCVSFQIYSLEGLAVSLLRQGSGDRSSLGEATRLRKSARLRRTAWDLSRLGVIPRS
jgi:hypothetical protein